MKYTVSNWTVSAYPTCELTCNSGYTKSDNSCIAIVSSGGGWWGWGGWWSITDYEDENSIDKTILSIENSIFELYKKYWILDISNITNRKITWDNWIIDLRIWLKSKSKLLIPENTTVLWEVNSIYAPYTIEIVTSLKRKTLIVNNTEFKAYNIKKLFFTWNKEDLVSFDKDIEVQFNLWENIEWNIYAFYSDDVDWNFSLYKSWLITDENWIVSLKTNKLWYFIFIRDIYIEKYLPNLLWNIDNTIINNENNSDIVFDKLNEELKNQIKNSQLNWIIDKFYKELEIPEIEYYISFDKELEIKYNNVINWYKKFIINLDDFLSTNDSSYQIEAWKWYIDYLKVNELKNFEEKYITKTYVDSKLIYKTKYTPIIKIVDALEKKVLIKLNTLLQRKTITLEKYNETINNYNQFILHLSIYREYGNKSAALKALTPGQSFLKVYKMNVVYTPEIIIENETEIDNNEAVDKIKIKDKYSFTRELKFWDYNNEVQNLQEIMKSYWYFTYSQTTMYFGSVTKESFINFSHDLLGSNSNDWILTKELIEKLNYLDYKN